MLVHLQDDVGERPLLDRVGKMVEEICTSDDPSRAVTLLENVITSVQFAAWNYSIDRGDRHRYCLPHDLSRYCRFRP
jgi:hypothetical protein